MLLVLGIPDPVALRLVRRLVERGDRVAVVAGSELQAELDDGVEFYVGDAASIDFGLTGPEYTGLVERVTSVYLVYSGLRAATEVEKSRAVRQAAELREFVRAGGAPRGVLYLSSLLVFGNARGWAAETELAVGQKFLDEHEEALAVAERIVHSSADSRVLRILRVAPIVGDEEAGEVIPGSPLDQLVRNLEHSRQERGYAFTDLPVRFETVDRAVEALVRMRIDLDRATTAGLKVIHLIDDDPLSDRQLVGWLAERLHRHIVETPTRPRPWNQGRLSFPGSRAVTGWGLHFSRTNAEEMLSNLLIRDDTRVLEKLFPKDSITDE